MRSEAELRRLQGIYDEDTLTEKHVEVEIVHDGHSTLHWSRLRKIGRGEVDGIATETWETVERGSKKPTLFTVFTGSEGLFAHMADVNYMRTTHGSKVVMTTINIAMVCMDLLLISMMLGAFGVSPDFSQWYFVGPVFLIIGIVVPMVVISERSVAKILTIECACPRNEVGGNHVCYICHSKISNVIQQMDAMKTSAPIFLAAIEKLKEELTDQRVADHDRTMMLEGQCRLLAGESVYAGGQKANIAVITGRGGSSIYRGMPMWMVGGAIAATAIVAAGLAWYFSAKGG